MHGFNAEASNSLLPRQVGFKPLPSPEISYESIVATFMPLYNSYRMGRINKSILL